ncbi:MAG: hypothetical protein JXN64_00340 [Spirochaetes bacterium]|nr:hypothetical protein [Spirochaetota bacterium]
MSNIKSYSEFMNAVEAYYCSYENAFKKEIVFTYVRKNFSMDQLDNLFAVLRQKYPSQYKTPPDEHIFHSLSNGSPEAKAEQAWADMARYNSGHSVLCADPVAQEAVKSMGGWDEFCEYRAKDNHWCHNDFVERYANLQASARNAEPEVLKGFTEKYYRKEIRPENVKLIGNQERGKMLLERAIQNVIGYECGMKQLKDVLKIPQEVTE